MRPVLPVIVIATALLSACSGPSAPQTDVLATGTCLADRDGENVDRASVVDCTEEHLFDVVGTVTWTGMDAAIAASDAAAVYDDIAADRNTDYDAATTTACDDLTRGLLGLDRVSLGGLDSTALDLYPSGPIGDRFLADRDAFIAGDHATLCVVRWLDVEDAERTVAYPEGIGFADHADPAFPTDQHVCAEAGDDGNVFLDCAELHETQQVLIFAGIDAVGAEWIATVDPSDFTAPDYTVPDAICSELISQAYPVIDQDAEWQVWSNVFTGSSG